MIYVLLNVLVAVSSGCIQNYYCKNLISNSSDSYLFIIIADLVAVLGLLFVSPPLEPSAQLLGLSALQGLILAAETVCIMEAMRIGSFSLTSLFSLSALLIPVCFSAVIWHERMTLMQILGTVLVLVSMAMTLNVGKKDGQAVSRRWIGYALAAFVLGGLAGLGEKNVLYTLDASLTDSFAFYSYLSLITVLLIALSVRRIRTGEKPALKLKWKHVLPICYIGAGNSAVFLLLLAALRVLPTATVYGTVNGARLMLTTVLDVVLFHQKLEKIQFAGLAVGLVAIIFLSL